MANLKVAMGSAETLGELYALIEDYSYVEFMQTYSQLTPEQQAKLNAIEERENYHQLVAIRDLRLNKIPVIVNARMQGSRPLVC